MDEIEVCLFSQPELGIMSSKEWTSGRVKSAVWLSTSKEACTALKNLSIPKWHLRSLLFCVSNVCYFPWNQLGSRHGEMQHDLTQLQLPNIFILFFPLAQWRAEHLSSVHYLDKPRCLPGWGLLTFSLHLECSMFPIFIGLLLPILWFQCHLHEEVFPHLNCLHLLSRIMNNL